MRAYKHIDVCFADAFRTGASISIGLLSYYRGMEGDRSDPLEGSAAHIQTTPIINPGRMTAQNQQDAALFGIALGGNIENLHVSGNVLINRLPEQYLFCASIEPDFSRIDNFKEAIFEISDFERFARTVQLANSEILGAAMSGEVKYRPRSVDPMKTGPITPHPLIKDPKFAFEREIRALWTPIDGAPEPRVFLSAPEISDLLTQVA